MIDPTKPKPKQQAQNPFAAENPFLDDSTDHEMLTDLNPMTGEPESLDLTTLEDAIKTKTMHAATMIGGGGPAVAGVKALGGRLAQTLPYAKAGGQLLSGNLTGAIKTFKGTPLSQALSGGEAAAPAAHAAPSVSMEQGFKLAGREAAERGSGLAMEKGLAALKPTVPELAGTPLDRGFKLAAEAAAKRGSGTAMEEGIAALSKAPTPVSMEQGFAAAGQAGRAGSQGSAAMSRGMEAAANVPKPTPLTLEEAFAAAGSAGRRASEGSAAMAEGIAKASKPMPLDLGLMGAGIGGAAMNPAQALQGFEMPQEPPAPPPLSSNAGEARMMGLSAIAAGTPPAMLYQQLSQTYDPATVEFVLAALPNRMPQ